MYMYIVISIICHMVLPESIRVSANIRSYMAAKGFHTSTDVIFRRAIGPEGVVPTGCSPRKKVLCFPRGRGACEP